MFDFDYSKTGEETREHTPIETGDYQALIETAEVKTTQKGQQYINLKLKLHTKRVVFDRLNFESDNAIAKEIATKKFQSICFFGIENPQAKFKSLGEMAAYIQGVSLNIYYSNKGKDERGYDKFNVTYKSGMPKVNKSAAAAPKSLY